MKEIKKVKNKESKKEKGIEGVWRRYTRYSYSEKITNLVIIITVFDSSLHISLDVNKAFSNSFKAVLSSVLLSLFS